MRQLSQPIYVTLGVVSLLVGLIGVFLPLLPTTPFVLLAAYFFSRSSGRLHQWLLRHRVFGSIIRDWESNGAIRPKAKLIAVTMITLSLGYALVFKAMFWQIKFIAAIVGIVVVIFIVTRPSHPGVLRS